MSLLFSYPHLFVLIVAFGHSKLFSMKETVELINSESLIKERDTNSLNNLIGPFFSLSLNSSTLKFNCKALFSYESEIQDQVLRLKIERWKQLGYKSSRWPPPKYIPPKLLNSYLMDGKACLRNWYFMEMQNGGIGYDWTLESLQNDFPENTCGQYNMSECSQVITKYETFIKNKTGLVIGSQTHWAESALFQAGAAHLTTIEYMKISTTHPRLSTIHPFDLSFMYQNGSFSHADFAWSYSSIEHDGLGRYGDPLNPFGDLEALARINCLLKPGGILFLAVPIGFDTVVWNAHRVYGMNRLSLILSFWEIVDLLGNTVDISDSSTDGEFINHPIWVLKKLDFS
jgi:hypothetical protein